MLVIVSIGKEGTLDCINYTGNKNIVKPFSYLLAEKHWIKNKPLESKLT